MGQLPEAVGQTAVRSQEELALLLQMHDELRPERPAFARCATIALLHLVVIAGLHLTLSEPARAADAKPDECGLASVYSTLSEETASGQDTSVNDRTAAHRSLPFETLVRVDNQENGSLIVVRITDRGPFVCGRIVDVSQLPCMNLLRSNAGLPQNPVAP
jgi:rare lipoprotein A (peptidoglycan hydrolase)